MCVRVSGCEAGYRKSDSFPLTFLPLFISFSPSHTTCMSILPSQLCVPLFSELKSSCLRHFVYNTRVLCSFSQYKVFSSKNAPTPVNQTATLESCCLLNFTDELLVLGEIQFVGVCLAVRRCTEMERTLWPWSTCSPGSLLYGRCCLHSALSLHTCHPSAHLLSCISTPALLPLSARLFPQLQ